MTNKQFADAMGCSISHASLLRNGHRLPSASILAHMGEIFGVDVSKAIRGTTREDKLSSFRQFVRDEVFGDSSRAA